MTAGGEFVPATDELLYERARRRRAPHVHRPQARNAMTWAMYEGLYQACEHAHADERVRVLVLRGAGDKAFVAGTDIGQFRTFSTRLSDPVRSSRAARPDSSLARRGGR